MPKTLKTSSTQERTMKWLLLSILLFFVACTPTSVYTSSTDNQQASIQNCPTPDPVIQAHCPFNKCFGDNYVAHKYFTTSAVAHGLTDDACNKPFEEQFNESNYLCFIKSAQPQAQVGQNANGDLLWDWEIICGCSYERVNS